MPIRTFAASVLLAAGLVPAVSPPAVAAPVIAPMAGVLAGTAAYGPGLPCPKGGACGLHWDFTLALAGVTPHVASCVLDGGALTAYVEATVPPLPPVQTSGEGFVEEMGYGVFHCNDGTYGNLAYNRGGPLMAVTGTAYVDYTCFGVNGPGFWVPTSAAPTRTAAVQATLALIGC